MSAQHTAGTSKLLMTILQRITEREQDPILLARSIHTARHLLESLNKGWVPEVDDPDIRIAAAAPDLLQALEELMAEAEYNETDRTRSADYQLAEDAVRKAKGLEPIARFPTVGEREVW